MSFHCDVLVLVLFCLCGCVFCLFVFGCGFVACLCGFGCCVFLFSPWNRIICVHHGPEAYYSIGFFCRIHTASKYLHNDLARAMKALEHKKKRPRAAKSAHMVRAVGPSGIAEMAFCDVFCICARCCHLLLTAGTVQHYCKQCWEEETLTALNSYAWPQVRNCVIFEVQLCNSYAEMLPLTYGILYSQAIFMFATAMAIHLDSCRLLLRYEPTSIA